MIRIALVDDHQIVIDGIISMLNTVEKIKVVGSANSGVGLIDLLSKEELDLVLMDISMPVMDGIETTRIVKEKYPNLKVLMLSMHDDLSYTKDAINAGADGFLLKNTGKEEFQKSIFELMDGNKYYSKKIMQNVIDSMKEPNKEEVVLSEREKEVLILIAQEYTTKEIAEKLFISHHTVESHRKNLLFKLDVRGVAGLVKYAIENGIVED